MNDNIRIGLDWTDSKGNVISPFMIRTGRNKVAYGFFRPNPRANNPTLGGTKVYLFDPESSRTRRVGSLGTLLPGESTQPYSTLSTQSVRKGIYRGLKTLANEQSSSIKSSVSYLRKAHYPAEFVQHVNDLTGYFTRS